MAKKRVVVYIRIHKAEALSAQKEHYNRLFVNRDDAELIDIYCDVGASGLDINRPEYSRMIADAKQNKFDYIIVEYLGNICRKTATAISEIEKLKNLGIGVFAIENTLDSLHPNWMKALKDLQEVAESYSKQLNIKTKLRDKMNRP